MITLTKRYSRLAAEKAAAETDPARKKELEDDGGGSGLVHGKAVPHLP